MESEPEPPLAIANLQVDEVQEFHGIIKKDFKSRGGLLRDRSFEEILYSIHEYFVVRIEGIIVGAFQLRESQTPERYLELGAFVVCTTQKDQRRKVKDDIINFSLQQSNDKFLELISLSAHPALQIFYEHKGAEKLSRGIFPERESISPAVPIYSFSN